MLIALTAATLLVALMTSLPWTRAEGWWVRAFDFPRVQIAALAAAVSVADLALLPRDEWSTWALAALAAASLAVQLIWIAPYTPLFPVEVRRARSADPARGLRLMSANVLMTNRRAGDFVGLVRRHDPDVLVTLESDAWWERALRDLEADYPFRVRCPLSNLYGMHLYSKLALEEAEVEYLVEDDKPSIHALVRLRSERLVRLHVLHPAPPAPGENPSSSERDAELLVVAERVADCGEPLIVTGDLNDVAWSKTTRAFRRLSGLRDPRRGRGMFNTFHAERPLLRFPLDHLFLSDHFSLAGLRRVGPFGSDHFALVADLVLERRGGGGDGPAPPSEEERELARRKASDEDVRPDDVPAPSA